MPECEDCFKRLENIAKKIKRLIQMFIGLSITFILFAKLYLQIAYTGETSSPDETINLLMHLVDFHPLEIVGYGLSVSAGIELAYMLFSKGPDEAVEPLILGLASSVLIIISHDDLIKWEVALTVLVFTLSIGFLFFIRQKYDVTHDIDDICKNNLLAKPQLSNFTSSIKKQKRVPEDQTSLIVPPSLKFPKTNPLSSNVDDESIEASKDIRDSKEIIHKINEDRVSPIKKDMLEGRIELINEKTIRTGSFTINLKECRSDLDITKKTIVFFVKNESINSTLSINNTSRILTTKNKVIFPSKIQLDDMEYDTKYLNEPIKKVFYENEITLLTLVFSNIDITDSQIFLVELVGKDSGNEFSIQFIEPDSL